MAYEFCFFFQTEFLYIHCNVISNWHAVNELGSWKGSVWSLLMSMCGNGMIPNWIPEDLFICLCLDVYFFYYLEDAFRDSKSSLPWIMVQLICLCLYNIRWNEESIFRSGGKYPRYRTIWLIFGYRELYFVNGILLLRNRDSFIIFVFLVFLCLI